MRVLVVVAAVFLAFVLGAGWNEMVAPFGVIAVCAVGIAFAWWMAGIGVNQRAYQSSVPAGYSGPDPKILMSASRNGIREPMRETYHKHYLRALQQPPTGGDPPHVWAMCQTLGNRYLVTGKPVVEIVIQMELVPFVCMEEQKGREMLIEYIVWQERPQDAFEGHLKEALNTAITPILRERTRFLGALAMAFLNDVSWTSLLNSANKELMLSEVEGFVRRSEGH